MTDTLNRLSMAVQESASGSLLLEEKSICEHPPQTAAGSMQVNIFRLV